VKASSYQESTSGAGMKNRIFLVIVVLLVAGGTVIYLLGDKPNTMHESKGTTSELNYDNQRVKLDVYNPKYFNCPVVILIHGAAGIGGDRAIRYKGFATDLMNKGIIAINVHYFNSRQSNWVKTIIKTIDYAEAIPNANKNKIGIVGYSLGGTLALQVASIDKRVALLAINAGYLPSGFTKENVRSLPSTYMISGTEDSAINTLNQLKAWFEEFNKPFKSKVDEGVGHALPANLFEKDWQTTVEFFTENFGL
jgi:dienelactone hydrolase